LFNKEIMLWKTFILLLTLKDLFVKWRRQCSFSENMQFLYVCEMC